MSKYFQSESSIMVHNVNPQSILAISKACSLLKSALEKKKISIVEGSYEEAAHFRDIELKMRKEIEGWKLKI